MSSSFLCTITYLDQPPRFEFSESRIPPVDATGFRPLPMERLKHNTSFEGKVIFKKETGLVDGTYYPRVKEIEAKAEKFVCVRI